MSDSAGRKVTSHPFTRWTEPDMSGAVRVRSGMLCKLCGQPESTHVSVGSELLDTQREFIFDKRRRTPTTGGAYWRSAEPESAHRSADPGWLVAPFKNLQDEMKRVDAESAHRSAPKPQERDEYGMTEAERQAGKTPCGCLYWPGCACPDPRKPPAQPHNAAPDPEDRPVRVNRSKEWWMKKAHAEGDTTIGAGVPDSGDRLLRAEANRLTWMFPPTVREDAIHAALEAVVAEEREALRPRIAEAATRMYSAAAVLRAVLENVSDDRIGATRKLLIDSARDVDRLLLDMTVIRARGLKEKP